MLGEIIDVFPGTLSDGFLRKYDTEGNELWTRRIQGAATHTDYALGVATDDTGVYVAGIATGPLPGQAPADDRDWFVQKYDADGNVLWTRRFVANITGTEAGSNPTGKIVVDAGGLYIAGAEDVSGAVQAFIRKYDKAGNALWSRVFGPPDDSPDFTDFNTANGVAIDSMTVYVSGSFTRRSGSGLDAKAFVRRYDRDGNELATYECAGSGDTDVNAAYTVAAGRAGVYAAGSTRGTLPGQVSDVGDDVFVMKLSSVALPCYPHMPTIAADSPLRIINEGQTTTQTGVYTSLDPTDFVAITASVGQVSKTGDKSGTWTWSLAATDGPAQNQTVTITADDGLGGLSVALFELIVTNVVPLVHITGAPASGASGTPISLGSTVTDPGAADTGTGFTYAWTVSRNSMQIVTGSGSSFNFTPQAGGTYQVDLQVTDKDGGTGTDTVAIPVAQTNQAPVANAGLTRTVRLKSLARLDGSQSADPDNGPQSLSFSWVQTVGPVISLTGATTATPSFTPLIAGTYVFSLTVSDGQDVSLPASVSITVPLLGDVDLDGDVDTADVNLILAARNLAVNGANDLRDIDGNGAITALDARKAAVLCTRPRCATR